MAYSSPDDIVQAYPKTFTTAFTTENLRTLIADADAMIDARLSQRYAVPFAGTPQTTPPIIRSLSRVLAVADVFDRSQTAADWVIRRIERAYATLDAIAAGDLLVVDTAGNRVPLRGDIGVPHSTTEGYIPTFGVGPTINETVDPFRALDEDNARR